MTDVGRHHYPFLPIRLLLRDTFRSDQRIALIHAPVLVIAARRDTIVPTPLSERLFSVAPARNKRLVIVEGADHNDYELLAGPQVIDAVVGFLRDVRGPA
jgi:uncharacterized protein